MTLTTRPVPLGPCQCPGTPHPDGDEAQVYTVLGWPDLVDIGMADSEGAGRLVLITRAIARWNLVELANGKPYPVPIVEASVRLLDDVTMTAIAEAANEAYEAARAPVPNVPDAPSPDSSPESASPSPAKNRKPSTSTSSGEA